MLQSYPRVEAEMVPPTTTFGPNTTLILEPDVVHQIVNASNDDMKLIAALAMAPVRVKTGEGDALPVPWDAPDPT